MDSPAELVSELVSSTGAPSASAFDLVAVAASLGGVTACRELLGGLPHDFPAAIVVLQHRSSTSSGYAAVLDRVTKLDVQDVEHGASIRPGVVYVAPGSGLVTVSDERRFVVSHAPDVPCRANPFLIASAAVYGRRMIGAVLTGLFDDGAEGIRSVKKHGGRVLVQDPDTAQAAGMPRAAMATGCADFVLPLGSMPSALTALTMMPGAADLFRVSLPPWATFS
jgi:two-component system, chemotaxis family, protein-glutamate methylesterase/glutaminase